MYGLKGRIKEWVMLPPRRAQYPAGNRATSCPLLTLKRSTSCTVARRDREPLEPDQVAKLAAASAERRKLARDRMQNGLAQGLRVVVDCGLVTGDITKQELAAFEGPIVDAARYIGGDNWHVIRHSSSALQIFKPEEVVILSPDAVLPLTHVDLGKVYCIGGIIDRSVVKYTTLDLAMQNNVTARRLPISENAAQLGFGARACLRPVLNVSDAFVALVGFHSSGDWAKALDAAIPARKRVEQVQKPKKARQRDPAWTLPAELPSEDLQQSTASRDGSGLASACTCCCCPPCHVCC